MRLVFVIDNTGVFGGGSYYIFKLAEHLSLKSIKVTVLLFAENKYEYQTNSFLDIVVLPIRVPNFNKLSSLSLLAREIQIIMLFDKILNDGKGNVDFMISHQLFSSIVSQRISKKYNIPHVAFVFEYPNIFDERLQRRKTNQLVEKQQLDKENTVLRKKWSSFKKVLNNSNKIVCISKYTKKGVDSWLGNGNSKVVVPGIDLEIINSIKSEEKLNQIIYVGRLYPIKNVDDIILALSLVTDPPELVIIGDGWHKNKLVALSLRLGVKCKFLGRVSEERKFEEIKKSKFMIFPTEAAGFAMPPMEALACGIPCIVPNIEVMQEVSPSSLEFFEIYDIKGLAKHIEILNANKNLLEKRGRNGKRYIADNYSWEKSSQTLKEILYEK